MPSHPEPRYVEAMDLTPPRIDADSSPAPIWSSDAGGRIVGVNRAWCDYTGHSFEAAAGRPWTDWVHPEDIAGIDVTPAAGTADFLVEYRLRRADRVYRWFLGNVTASRDTDGNLTGFTGVQFDVSSHRIPRAELERAKHEAEAANRAKSHFLATVSHELRTPLNAVIGFAEMIRDQLLGPIGEPRYGEYAGDIHRSASHLLGVLGDILDLSTIESGRYVLDDEECRLSDIIERSVRLVRDFANERSIFLEQRLPADLPAVMADGRALKQVLLNVLSNAVKFTPVGGHVVVAASLGPAGRPTVTISDNGIGMTPESIVKAFAPFGQVDSALSRQFHGTGLGLPLSRSLVELHGGTLGVESTRGEGTTVSVSLPSGRVVNAA